MKVYIAEKPSLGRAIADVLPKPHTKEEGCIRLGNGDYVTWCIGHLLELAEPHDYDERFKKWNFEHLPIIPPQWQLRPKPNTLKQLGVIRRLITSASSLVHAGDPDREGQLLVDEVIHFVGVKGTKLATAERLLINDLNPTAVQQSLQQMQPNTAFSALSTSALARSRADWLYGINMTRAYSLQGQKKGYQSVLSVGRVQTPVLGLVVRRDLEITNFTSKAFYEVRAHLQANEAAGEAGSETFMAQWQPSEACASYCDEEGRVLSEALARNVVQRINQQPAVLSRIERQPKRHLPPLPYSLSALQIDAANQLNLSAQDVLNICQTLYEQHNLITYPRSDSRYLPSEQWAQAEAIFNAIAHNLPSAIPAIQGADSTLKSKCWNNAKVEAHHAIIPTQKRLASQKLSASELGVYRLIVRQYVAQFYAPYEFIHTRMEFLIAGGLFVAQGQTLTALGWKHLFPKKNIDTEDAPQQALPSLQQEQRCWCTQGELLSKQTSPPKYFTDATLMAAMTGINRFVSQESLKKILKETDGIGTEATRASIVELLFKREFLIREGKSIRATAQGKALIAALPEVATTPDMTATWELALAAIHHKTMAYEAFINPLNEQLKTLIAQSQYTQLNPCVALASRSKSNVQRNTTRSTTRKTPPKTSIKITKKNVRAK